MPKDRLYRLSTVNIMMAGAAMDYLLNNPRLIPDMDPVKLAALKATRDLFETYNSENYVLDNINASPA